MEQNADMSEVSKLVLAGVSGTGSRRPFEHETVIIPGFAIDYEKYDMVDFAGETVRRLDLMVAAKERQDRKNREKLDKFSSKTSKLLLGRIGL